jgi:opacity protein-like surface antigen
MTSSIQSRNTTPTQQDKQNTSGKPITPPKTARSQVSRKAADLINGSAYVYAGSGNSASGSTSTTAYGATTKINFNNNDSLTFAYEHRNVNGTKTVTTLGTPDIPATPDRFVNDQLVRGTPAKSGTPASSKKVNTNTNYDDLSLTANRPNPSGTGFVAVGGSFKNGELSSASVRVGQKFKPQKLDDDTTLNTSASVGAVIPVGGEASFRPRVTADVKRKLSDEASIYAGGVAELRVNSQGVKPVAGVKIGAEYKPSKDLTINAEYQQNLVGTDGTGDPFGGAGGITTSGNALKVGVGYSF